MGVSNETMTFGEWLKKIRNQHGIGSRELSKLIGKTESYVSQIERGALKNVSFYIGFQLLKQFNMNDDEILKNLSEYNIRPKAQSEIKLFNIYTNKKHMMKNNTPNLLNWIDEETQIYLDKNTNIFNALNKFVERDFSKAKSVISGLETILLKDKLTFDIFCRIILIFLENINENDIVYLDFFYRLISLNYNSLAPDDRERLLESIHVLIFNQDEKSNHFKWKSSD